MDTNKSPLPVLQKWLETYAHSNDYLIERLKVLANAPAVSEADEAEKQQFKDELKQAIAEPLITPDQLGDLLNQIFDTQAEVVYFLRGVWEYVYPSDPELSVLHDVLREYCTGFVDTQGLKDRIATSPTDEQLVLFKKGLDKALAQDACTPHVYDLLGGRSQGNQAQVNQYLQILHQYLYSDAKIEPPGHI